MAVTRYTVTCQRSGGWWAISAPKIKGLHSQARRLDQVEAMARDAISLLLDVPADSFTLDVRPELPDEAVEALRAREEAEQAERRAAAATRWAIEQLRAAGFSVRDTGSLLHLSPQRVSQIEHEAA